MSYDLYLADADGNAIVLDEPFTLRGGTYAIGGTCRAEFNVTYNYGKHFYRVLGEDGLRSIYGRTGAESIPMLEAGIALLGDDTTDNYWDGTEGNAKVALQALVRLAELAPDGVWDGD